MLDDIEAEAIARQFFATLDDYSPPTGHTPRLTVAAIQRHDVTLSNADAQNVEAYVIALQSADGYRRLGASYWPCAKLFHCFAVDGSGSTGESLCRECVSSYARTILAGATVSDIIGCEDVECSDACAHCGGTAGYVADDTSLLTEPVGIDHA